MIPLPPFLDATHQEREAFKKHNLIFLEEVVG